MKPITLLINILILTLLLLFIRFDRSCKSHLVVKNLMVWKLEEKILCVKTHTETKSCKAVQHLSWKIPDILELSQTQQKIREFIQRKEKLRAKSADNMEASGVSFGRNPKKSIRKRSSGLGISRSSLQRILASTLSSTSSRRKLSAKSADNVEIRILCTDERKLPRSLLRFRMDFFLLRPTETLDASTSSTDLAPNIFFLDGFSNFLLRLFTVP